MGKKKCIRELYTYKKRSTKSNNQPTQPTQSVQPIQTKDANAWDTVTIQKDAIQECAFVERVSPLEDVFQRLRRVKEERHYGDEVNMEINVLEQGGEEIYGQSEDDLEDGEKKPGEVLIMYLIALVIFLYFIKKSMLFKKSVPDWEKSIHYKTVDKSGGEVSESFRTLFLIVFFAFLFYCFAKNFVFK